MKSAISPLLTEKKAAVTVSPRGWLAASIILSVLVVSVMAWLHLQQRQSLSRTVSVLDTMRKARIELSKGLLYTRLSGEPGLPFNREQGLQLIQQSLDTLTVSTRRSEFELDSEAKDSIAHFQQHMKSFREFVSGFSSARTPEQETEFRLQYFELEQEAESIDAMARNNLQSFYHHLDKQFGWVFLISLTLLLGNFGLVNTSLRAKAAVDNTLKATQAELEQAVKAANVGLWTWKLGTDEVRYSNEWKSQIGYGPDEISNSHKAWEMLVHPDDLEQVTRRSQEYLSTLSGTNESVFRLRHKDGKYRWILSSSSAQLDEQGNPVTMLGAHIDITDRKLAEDALRESELLFRNVFNQLFQLMVILTPEGRIRELNDLSLRERGNRREECIGKLYWEAPGWENIPNAEQIWKPLIEKAATVHEPLLIEQTYPGSDGRERSADCAIQAIRNAEGVVQFIIIQAMETTQRKQAEEALRLSEDRLRQLHRIVSNPALSHPERIQQLLRLGVEQFEAENGVLAQVIDKQYKVVQSHSLKDEIPEGFSCKISDVLCQETLRRGEDGLALENVPASSMRDHVACTAFGTQSYLGVPVQIDAHTFGTLSFFSRAARVRSYTSGDQEFLRLMAQWIGAELTRYEAEDKLRRSEERSRLALDAGKMGAWCYYPEKRLMEADENSCKLFGIGINNFSGEIDQVKAMIHPDDYERVAAQVAEALANRTLYETEYRIIYPDQSVHWVGSIGRSVFRQSGAFHGFKGVIFDITERKLAEEKLLQSERHFRTLFEAGGVANVECDANTGKFLLVNQKMCELTGYAAAELLEMEVADITHPDDSADDIAMWKSCLKGKGTTYFNEKRFVRKDGSVIWVSVTASVLHDEAGEPSRAVGVIQDVTARKKAEASLRESEERFRILFEQSAVGNVIIDIPTRRFVDCNSIACQMLGYSREEFLQLSVQDINAQFDSADLRKIGDEMTRHGRAQFETIHRTKSGKLQHALVVVTNITIDGVLYGATSFVDITEQKRTEQALHAERQRLAKIARVSPGVIFSYRIWSLERAEFIYASPAIYEIYGKTPEELADGTLIFDSIHPEDLSRLINGMQQSLETGKDFHETWRVNNPHKGEIWVECNAALVKEDAESVTWYGVLNDVTARVRTEVALQDNEKLFRNVFNQQFQYMAILSHEGRILEINELPLRLSKTQRSDYIGKFLWDTPLGRLQPHWPTLWPERLKHAAETRESILTEDIYYSMSGELGHADVAITAIRNENNVIEYFIIQASDTTKRKRQESQLAERERLISAINNTAPNMIILWNISEGVPTYVNNRIEHTMGYAPGEFLSFSAEQLRELFSPVSWQEIQVHHKSLAREVDGTQRELEVQVRHKNGEWRTLLGRDVVFSRDERGRPATVLSLVEDITERKRAEDALRESEQRFRQLTESLPQLVWTCEPDGQCDYLSPQWIAYTGVPAEQQLGFGWLELVHPADRELAFTELQQSVAESRNLDVEFRVRRHDGVYRWFQTRAIPFKNDEGKIVKWFGTNTDVQALREMGETLHLQKEHLQTLADASRRFAEAGPDYDSVAEAVVKVVGETNKDFSTICLISENGELIQTAGAYHPDPNVQELINQSLNREANLLQDSPFDLQIYETGEPAFVPHTSSEVLEPIVDARYRPIVKQVQFSGLIITPMRNEGMIMGLVCIGRTQSHLPPFTENDLHLLQEISDRAALALRNAQLYQQVQEELTRRQKTEIKLHHEQERLSAIAAATPGVLYTFRQAPDGTYSIPYASPSVERFYGVNPATLHDDVTAIAELTHPDDLVPFRQSIADSARDMTPWRYEWRISGQQEGEWLWVEGQSVPMRQADGGIIWYGVLTDITERKRQQQELATRESLISAINNAAPNMILLCDLRSSSVVYVNQRVETLMGYTEEEFLAKKHSEVFALMHPEDLPSVYQHLDALRRSAEGTVLSYEFRFWHKEGRWRNVRARDFVFERDEKGRATKILSVVDDVTESLQQEAKLRARQRQQSALAELSQLALTRFDMQTILQEAAALVRLTLETDGCHIRKRVLEQNEPVWVASVGLKGQPGQNTEILVNIQTHGGPYGVLAVYSCTEREFSLDDLNFLQAVANVLSMTLERHDSDVQLLHSREELRELATHLQSVREEERTAIAREIHDEFGQQLTAVRLNLRWIEKNATAETPKVRERITDTLTLVDNTIQVVRQIATSLHPAILDSFGLPAALEWQVQEFEKHSGIRCFIESMPASVQLERRSAIAVFRICQETLTNIARHANATEVSLKLWVDDDSLWLRIHDNGRGITPEAQAASRSLGLVGMRERALSLGGEFKITGRPGRGTTVKVRVLLAPGKSLAVKA